MEVLDKFCNLASQKVNFAKSRILFSLNVTEMRKETICRKLRIRATQNLGRYLGFPLFHQGKNRDAFNFAIEKVHNKLSGWKLKFLSKAGKLVLVKSTATPTVEYYM